MAEYLLYASSEGKLKDFAQGFEQKWQYNDCVGAVDGKHIVIQAPSRSGQLFSIMKKSFHCTNGCM